MADRFSEGGLNNISEVKLLAREFTVSPSDNVLYVRCTLCNTAASCEVEDFNRNSPLQAVWDTSIARTTGLEVNKTWQLCNSENAQIDGILSERVEQ